MVVGGQLLTKDERYRIEAGKRSKFLRYLKNSQCPVSNQHIFIECVLKRFIANWPSLIKVITDSLSAPPGLCNSRRASYLHPPKRTLPVQEACGLEFRDQACTRLECNLIDCTWEKLPRILKTEVIDCTLAGLPELVNPLMSLIVSFHFMHDQ